jgi:hypothetical protein
MATKEEEEKAKRDLLNSDTPEGKLARAKKQALDAATRGFGLDEERSPARKAIDDFEGQRAVNQMNNPEVYAAPPSTSPADTSDPNEKLDQMGDLFGVSDVATELQGRNYSTEGETPDTSIIQPPSFGNSGITKIGGETTPSLFGLETGGLKTGGLETGGLKTGGLKTGGLKTGGLETGGLETGAKSGEEPSKPRQTAQEFASGQKAPAGDKPETDKPEDPPYRRKRASEIGIVADRGDRTRGRQKFAEEIGGAGGYDKLSDEQKDRGLELGLQERDISKFYNKKDDERRRR